MQFPTPWTVTLHVHSYGPRNSHGERVDTYTDRIEPVIAWSPPSASVEDFEQGRRAVESDLDLLVPPSWSHASNDEVTITTGPNTGRYTIEGEVEDFTHGPFGFAPGGRVSLRRVVEAG